MLVRAMTKSSDQKSLHSLLKEATAVLHGEVDLKLSKNLNGRRDGYPVFLRIMASAILPLEDLLTAKNAAAFVTDWPLRSRSAELKADLAALGLEPYVEAIELPDFGEAHALGIMYVLEGSRLGGRVILSRLAGGSKALPTRFLSHGHGRLWQSFLSQLEMSDAAQRHTEKLVEGATFAFRRFETITSLGVWSVLEARDQF